MPPLSVRRAPVFGMVAKPLTTSFDAGVPLRDVQEAASHADPRTTMRYDNSQELHQPGEKLQVSSSQDRRNGVPLVLMPAL
jgi:hypothetical protein